MNRLLPTLVAVGMLALSSGASAGLVGDSVTGVLVQTSLEPTAGVTTQFVSPAIVGVGTEFSGVWSYPNYGQIWNVAVDVGDTSITVTTFNSGDPTGLLSISGGLIRIDLGDLDMGSDITGVSQSAGDAVKSIAFTAHQVSLEWNVLFPESNTFVFDLVAAGPRNVPEPGSLALVGAALAAAALARRRRAACSS